ncbi:uncharacterized protein magl [Myxocyprinus asiaticus]|uniref:uncharacterized protein magl n=1 Tax=Myxocyprinus asiaticus TaxID=70543 RepID=UPI00222191E1|nr:uncharacterized protein magl [Myxocyprinus asiaticus]
MTCAHVREYNSNPPPQVHIFPVKKHVRGSDEASYELSSLHPAKGHLTSQSIDRNSAASSVITEEPEPSKVLEIISECNWEAHRSLVLKQLFQYINMNHLTSTFFIDNYKVQLLSTEFKKHGASSMLIYKVCVSLGEKSGVTGEPKQDRNKRKITEEPLRLKNSTVQHANTLAMYTSNVKLDIINVDMETKTPERFPLISRILPAGYLKADKKTSVHPGLIKNSRMDHQPVECMSNLPLYKLTWHLNHTARKRKHRVELQQCFDSLRMTLNVEEHVQMSDQDVLIQARQMIGALEERSRSLIEKKRALIEKHSHYHALISQLPGTALQQKTGALSLPQTTPETAASNQSVAMKLLHLPSIVLMSFNKI